MGIPMRSHESQSHKSIEIITVEGLQKKFPQGFLKKPRQILRDISFTVKRGVGTGLIGLNGSGKTTTLQCMLGFLRADAGKINFSINKPIGYLPERPYYYDFLSAREYVGLHFDLLSLGDSQHAKKNDVVLDALSRVGLSQNADHKLKFFSKGMLQRVGLAQAMLGSPELYIFDEPMSGLDPDGREMVRDLLHEQISAGASVLFTSHLMQDVVEVCEDLIVIDSGRVLYQGTVRNLIGATNTGRELEKAFHTLLQNSQAERQL